MSEYTRPIKLVKEILGISIQAIKDRIKAGTLDGKKIGGRYFLSDEQYRVLKGNPLEGDLEKVEKGKMQIQNSLPAETTKTQFENVSGTSFFKKVFEKKGSSNLVTITLKKGQDFIYSGKAHYNEFNEGDFLKFISEEFGPGEYVLGCEYRGQKEEQPISISEGFYTSEKIEARELQKPPWWGSRGVNGGGISDAVKVMGQMKTQSDSLISGVFSQLMVFMQQNAQNAEANHRRTMDEMREWYKLEAKNQEEKHRNLMESERLRLEHQHLIFKENQDTVMKIISEQKGDQKTLLEQMSKNQEAYLKSQEKNLSFKKDMVDEHSINQRELLEMQKEFQDPWAPVAQAALGAFSNTMARRAGITNQIENNQNMKLLQGGKEKLGDELKKNPRYQAFMKNLTKTIKNYTEEMPLHYTFGMIWEHGLGSFMGFYCVPEPDFKEFASEIKPFISLELYEQLISENGEKFYSKLRHYYLHMDGQDEE